MYKSKEENVEVYFICYKKEDMELVESYYDEGLDIQYWYFNAYLAYQAWKKNFKGMKNIGYLSKQLLIVAASRYLLYMIENEEYKTKREKKIIEKDLEKIQKELEIIINDENILTRL